MTFPAARSPVTVLVNPDCPHCRQALDGMTEVAFAAGIPISGVDVLHHPEIAERYHVEASPVVVLGDRTVVPGCDAARLRELLRE